MICEKCGANLSDRVYQIHIGICDKDKSEEPVKRKRKDPELDIQRGLIKAELDEKGIKYHANAKTEYLLKLVEESKEA